MAQGTGPSDKALTAPERSGREGASGGASLFSMTLFRAGRRRGPAEPAASFTRDCKSARTDRTAAEAEDGRAAGSIALLILVIYSFSKLLRIFEILIKSADRIPFRSKSCRKN
jgi:hypothetical protein